MSNQELCRRAQAVLTDPEDEKSAHVLAAEAHVRP